MDREKKFVLFGLYDLNTDMNLKITPNALVCIDLEKYYKET